MIVNLFLYKDLSLNNERMNFVGHCFQVKVKYSLEGDNVLHQTITKPDGNVAFFKREFFDKEAKMVCISKSS